MNAGEMSVNTWVSHLLIHAWLCRHSVQYFFGKQREKTWDAVTNKIKRSHHTRSSWGMLWGACYIDGSMWTQAPLTHKGMSRVTQTSDGVKCWGKWRIGKNIHDGWSTTNARTIKQLHNNFAWFDKIAQVHREGREIASILFPSQSQEFEFQYIIICNSCFLGLQKSPINNDKKTPDLDSQSWLTQTSRPG